MPGCLVARRAGLAAGDRGRGHHAPGPRTDLHRPHQQPGQGGGQQAGSRRRRRPARPSPPRLTLRPRRPLVRQGRRPVLARLQGPPHRDLRRRSSRSRSRSRGTAEPDHGCDHHPVDGAGREGHRADPAAARRPQPAARRALPGLRLPLRRTDRDRPQPGNRHGHSRNTSNGWHPVRQRERDAIVVEFARTDCQACPVRPECTSARRGNRMLTLYPEHLHTALAAARTEQKTKTWKDKYALRAGVEGTINQARHHRQPPGPLPRTTESPSPARLLRHRDQHHPPRRPLDRPPPGPQPHQQPHPPQLPTRNLNHRTGELRTRVG
ncbi:transposase [Streptomyces sp. NPDC005151]